MNVAQARAAARPFGATVIEFDNTHYPPLLREIHDPPPLLYVKGDVALLTKPQLAVVGSRRASVAACRLTASLVSALVRAGLQVCSGLAVGIDSAAHRGALGVRGKTIAVMATGIDQVYPRRNDVLARDIVRGGCLVTEFAPGTAPRKQHFPRRNRIISGMCLGVVVIEAALPSGSLITARTALEQGREVFALPWSPLHLGGRGCLQLLRDGAKMVQDVDDILEELDPLYRRLSSADAATSSDVEATSWLLRHMGFEEISLDALVESSARPTAQVVAALSSLELAGRVERTAGGYIRC
ncbi:MAG: DNA-protecting protein DprA [Halioglobus sp.]|nr:DNA-protecting protein DprA [Halioglobus sp.]